MVYLGGYSYLLKNTSQNRSMQSEYVHLYTGELVSLNSRELRTEYQQIVDQNRLRQNMPLFNPMQRLRQSL